MPHNTCFKHTLQNKLHTYLMIYPKHWKAGILTESPMRSYHSYLSKRVNSFHATTSPLFSLYL